MIDLSTLRKLKTEKQFIHEWANLQELEVIESSTIGRRYVTPCGPLPSVTTFLGSFDKGEWLEKWVDKMGGIELADAEKNRCADRGTGLHNAIEALIRNKPDPSLAGKYLKMYNQLAPFIKIHLDVVYAAEACLWSNTLGLAGRVDCVGRLRGLRSILDWKSSNNWKQTEHIESYYLQTTAYAIMYEERTGEKIEHCAICICIENQEKCQIIEFDPRLYYKKLAAKIKEFREMKKATAPVMSLFDIV